MNEELFYWGSSQQAESFYGVTANTLRRWATSNKIEYKRKPSNQRVYRIPLPDNSAIQIHKNKIQHTECSKKYIYCRVSSYKQKDDLDRQCKFLSDKYPHDKIIKDVASGLNYKRRGLLYLLEECLNGRVESVVVYSKDRFCRFGFELLEWIFLQNNATIVVHEQSDKTKEQEFSEDILAILQVFACRWNGQRKYSSTKNEKNKNNTNDTITKTNDSQVE